jgi:hypothetical protein
MTDKLNPAPWVNMQEWHLHRAGEHPGTVGEHNQEWWVNMLRNLQKSLATAKTPSGIGSWVAEAMQPILLR